MNQCYSSRTNLGVSVFSKLFSACSVLSKRISIFAFYWKNPPTQSQFGSFLVSITGPGSWTWLYVRGLTKQSALATMEHSLRLRLLGTSLGLRPPTRPASMGGETPGNNYPGYFSRKNMHLSPSWPSSSRTLNLSRAHHMDAKCESYLRNFV